MLTWTSSRLSSNFRPTNPNRITPNRTINHRNCFPHFSIFFLPLIPSKLHRFKLSFQSRVVISYLLSIISLRTYTSLSSRNSSYTKNTSSMHRRNKSHVPNWITEYINIFIFRLHKTGLTHELSQFQLQSFSFPPIPVSGSNRVAKFPRRSRGRKLDDSVFAEGMLENTSSIPPRHPNSCTKVVRELSFTLVANAITVSKKHR